MLRSCRLSLMLLVLSLTLLARQPADAAGSPTPPPQPGHIWVITYSEAQTESYLVPDPNHPGETTPETNSWYTSPVSPNPYTYTVGNAWYESVNLNFTATDTVIATITWKPAAGHTLLTDPPPAKMVVEEVAHSWWHSHLLGPGFAKPSDAGVASDGLGDPEVFSIPWNTTDGVGTSSGRHQES